VVNRGCARRRDLSIQHGGALRLPREAHNGVSDLPGDRRSRHRVAALADRLIVVAPEGLLPALAFACHQRRACRRDVGEDLPDRWVLDQGADRATNAAAHVRLRHPLQQRR